MIVPINGDTNTFAAIAYGVPDPLAIKWCDERVNAKRQQLLPEAITLFEQNLNTVYSDIDWQSIYRTAKALDNRNDTIWMVDVISSLTDIKSIQTAPPIMVDWIMCHPEIRRLYHSNQIAGFDEYYQDPYPDLHDDDFFKYREVINGVFMETGNGEEMAATWYIDEFDDSVLDFSDQVDIINTWQSVLAFIQQGEEDPTSVYGNSL